MDIMSKNGKFIISMPTELHNGENLRGIKVDVYIRLVEGKEATFYNLADTVKECFDVYDDDEHVSWAPILYVNAQIKGKTYEFDINWQMEESKYICKIARQFML